MTWHTWIANCDGKPVRNRTLRGPDDLKGKPRMVCWFGEDGNWRAAGVWGANEIPASYLNSRLKYRHFPARLERGDA